MSEKKYVGSEALIRLVAQLKAGFASLTHKHSISDITDYTVDSSLSSTSTNPVQNKVVNSAISSNLSSAKSYTDSEVAKVTGGTVVVKEAEHADTADSATTATTATNANHATTADSATTAGSATSATSAIKDSKGNVIADTYQTIANATSQHNALQSAIDGKANASHSHSAATTSAAGFMSAADKEKLDGIAAGANNYTYTLPSAGSSLGGVKSGGDVTISSGVITVNDDSHNHVISNVDGLQSALDAKADASHSHNDLYYTEDEIDATVAELESAISGKAASSHSHSDATTSASGFMSASDKSKLAGIATGAEVNQNAFSNVTVGSTTIAADGKTDTLTLVAGSNVTLTPDATNDKITIAATDTVYTHPTTAGNKHIPSGGSSGQILRWSADGTAAWGADNNTTYSAGTGISLSGTTFSNSGVRSISSGSTNGTISVNTNGTAAEVAVKGLGSAAYTASSAYAAASHTHTVSQISDLTATAAELNKLDGVTATTTELNYVDGVTSNIQSQLDSKAASGHTHSNYASTVSTTGSGNAITAISQSGNTITATKGSTFSLSNHTHNYAGSSSAGGSATSAVKLATARNITLSGDVAGTASFNGEADASISTTVSSMHGVTTAGTGAAYTATVSGITSLTAGVSFIMIPHTNSTTTTPTLNVNSLGAKGIRMRGSSATDTAITAAITAWLASGRPVQVTYNGVYWVTEVTRTAASDLSGTVAIASGGTGATTAAAALTNLGAAASDVITVSSTEPTSSTCMLWIQV